jgi:predicted HD phosphohydrolase
MSEDEVSAFRAQPDWRLALKLREIDDQGKVPGAEVPGLEDYREELSDVVSVQLGGS